MNRRQSKALGALLRQKRQELGYSTTDVAKAAGMAQSNVVRFEQGQFTAPSPDKLARFAQALGLSLAEVYARAGYIVPDELPGFHAYLPAKYTNLPDTAIAELCQHFKELMTRHGLQDDDVAPLRQELADDEAGGVA